MPFPALPADKAVRFGFGLCVIGFGIACISLFPNAPGSKGFPWPVFAGSAVYMPGAILAFLNAKGRDRNQAFMWLRVIRMGFFAILAVALYRMSTG